MELSLKILELLKQTKANIYCLVRTKEIRSNVEAQDKLVQILKNEKLWKDEFESRVHGVSGDLSLEKLGMDDKLYENLAGKIDQVFHCGAIVNGLFDYQALKPSNVDGTFFVKIYKISFQEHVL